tara:strand:- start:46295 stop:47353 length:1059 start_codon:yes stop_codon:yes gene_type:complete
MMMVKKRFFIVKGILILVIFWFILSYNLNRPRIIIIHSYDTTLSSVRAFNKGFLKKLQHDKNPSILNYFMNTLNKQSERYKVSSGISAENIIQDLKPEVIVAVGEEAQEYVGKNYIGNPHISLVYAKIKDPSSYDYTNAKNVSGVQEQFPLNDVKKVLSSLKKNKKSLKLASIGDQTTLMKVDDKFILTHSWDPHVLTDSIMVDTFEEWKESVKKLNHLAEVDFIFLSNYRNLKTSMTDNTIVSSKDVISWTVKNSGIPVIGLYETNSKDGVPLSVSTSSLSEGKNTAQLVLEIIQEKAVKTKVLTTEHFLISLNTKYSMYDDLGIPEIYKSFAIASGLYYEGNKINGKYKL